jgi:hypothetical protein
MGSREPLGNLQDSPSRACLADATAIRSCRPAQIRQPKWVGDRHNVSTAKGSVVVDAKGKFIYPPTTDA